MPDVWTTNPSRLREYLLESGSTCGIPGRVLQERDPEWTCTFDSRGVIRDIYIHPVRDLYFTPPVQALFIVVFLTGLFLGLWWGRRFWRQRR
jgi:hypothetical protein